jgi:hypothetical protein
MMTRQAAARLKAKMEAEEKEKVVMKSTPPMMTRQAAALLKAKMAEEKESLHVVVAQAEETSLPTTNDDEENKNWKRMWENSKRIFTLLGITIPDRNPCWCFLGGLEWAIQQKVELVELKKRQRELYDIWDREEELVKAGRRTASLEVRELHDEIFQRYFDCLHGRLLSFGEFSQYYCAVCEKPMPVSDGDGHFDPSPEEGADLFLPPCGDYFHTSCMREWEKTHGSTCPLCRACPFTSVM